MDGGQDGVDLREAARVLEISPAAVRKRLKRKTLSGFKGTDGRWYVTLPDKADNGQDAPGADRELVDELRARVESLERALSFEREAAHRKDVLLAEQGRTLAELARRIPELPAGESSAQDGQDVDAGRTAPRGDTRPWWRFWGR